MQNLQLEINDEYDKEFILLIMEIEKRLNKLTKHEKLKIESWCKKLSQVTNNKEWKKNRNLHAICLLDMVLNNRFEAPYNKFAPEGSVPIISKALVKSKLSNKFQEIANSQAFSQGTTQGIGKENLNISDNIQQEEQNYGNSNNFNSANKNLSIQNKNKSLYKNNEAKFDSQELDNLRDVIFKLKNEIKLKNDIIKRQNEEKLKMENRINELEKVLSSLVNLENEK